MPCCPEVKPADETTIILTPDGVVIVLNGVAPPRGSTVLPEKII